MEIIKQGEKIPDISAIKRHVSKLEIAGDEYTLRPINGKTVALYQDKSIARIYQNKRKWYLEVDPSIEQNKILIAALMYKDWEWEKTNNTSPDDMFIIWLAPIPVFM